MFIVRSSTYSDRGKKYVTTVEVDAVRAAVTQASGGSVLSLANAEGDIVAFFQDWDSCWQDGEASIISVERTAPDEAPADAVPAEGGSVRPAHRG